MPRGAREVTPDDPGQADMRLLVLERLDHPRRDHARGGGLGLGQPQEGGSVEGA
jgi:hypothetical protein